MAASGSSRVRRVLDAGAYAAAMVLLVFLVGYAVSLLVGGGWFVVEAVMFVLGWLLFGYGTIRLRPTPPWKQGRGGVRGKIRDAFSEEPNRDDTKVEAAVAQVPGLADRLPPPDERFSIGTKLFVAGIAVLVASFLLERAVVA